MAGCMKTSKESVSIGSVEADWVTEANTGLSIQTLSRAWARAWTSTAALTRMFWLWGRSRGPSQEAGICSTGFIVLTEGINASGYLTWCHYLVNRCIRLAHLMSLHSQFSYFVFIRLSSPIPHHDFTMTRKSWSSALRSDIYWWYQ